jgi:cell division protein FtsB
MPPRSANKPSTALIVCLVLFVLLSLILGVTTYLGFNGQAVYAKAADDKAQKAKEAQELADFYQLIATCVEEYEGHDVSPTQKENLPALRRGFAGGTGPLVTSVTARDPKLKDAADTVAKLDADPNFGWDDTQSKPKKTYKQQFEDLTKDKDQLSASLAKADATIKERNAKIAGLQDELGKARADYLANLNKAKEDANKTIADERQKNATLEKDKEALGKSIEDLKADAAQKAGEAEKQLVKRDRQIKGQEATNIKLRNIITPPNILDYDHPKAHIKQVDPSLQTVYLDIGSADHLKAGITFSVYGLGPDGKPITHNVIGANGKPVVDANGVPEKEGKATIEVINVFGPHVSQARVTWVRHQGRDPILTGDACFNPSWDPNAHQHVAIAGLVDLNGSGHDDMQEFVRTLERQGVIVDSYLDLRTIKIKGQGIDRQTDYLILGPRPDFAGSDVAKEEDPRARRQTEILREMDKMQKQAEENGVTVVSLRKFLLMSGYHIPPNIGVDTGSGQSRPSTLINTGGGNGNAGR